MWASPSALAFAGTTMSETSPRLPLLAPPRPSFPARFDTSDRPPEASSSTAPWPEEARDEEETPSAPGGEDRGQVTWQIKTDKELHLDRLGEHPRNHSSRTSVLTDPPNAEARLQQLRADSPSDLPLAEDDTFLLPESGFDQDEEPTAELADDPPADPPEDENEEGRALLSDVASPAVQGLDESASRAAEDEVVDGFDESFGNVERSSRPAARLASRISFKDSVRITSGFRSSSHQHQHQHQRPSNALAPLTERTGLLSGQNRTGSAPSDLLVQAVAPSAASSRSQSPLARGSRRASQSSNPLGNAATLLHAGSYQYSSSPASYGGASRSSSPCSSIYAPLQPPSRHCPNPMLVRPIGGPLRRKRSSSSFQEFLRKNRHLSDDDDVGGDGDGDESEEDSDAKADLDLDDDENGGEGDGRDPLRLEYHDLVEQQRAKKAQWEARRRIRAAQKRQQALRDAPTLWTRVARVFLYGHSSSSGEGETPGRREARSAARTAAARGRLAARPPSSSYEHSPVRSSPLARAASHSSLSTVSTMATDSDSNAADTGGPPQQQNGGRRPPNGTTPGKGIKTEADVRFGPAPARYFTVGWIKHQFRRLKRAVAKLFRTAVVGWHASQQRKRERERAEGYGTV